MKKQPKKRVRESKISAIMRDRYTGDDVKRYIGAVTEEFQGHTSAIAEQFSGLNNKIDRLDNKIDSVEERLSNKLDTHTEMIGRLMIDVEDIKLGLREKVSREEFNKLETRLVSLESYVFTGRKRNTNKSSK